jgi:hypothetical protein
VINAFIYRMTRKVLIHALGRETSRTTWELLDIATQYATGHLSGGDGPDNPTSS